MNSSNLFVFYNFGTELQQPRTWEYPEFPTDWWWVGGGSLHLIDLPDVFHKEEQFKGPCSSIDDMYNSINNHFAVLKTKKVVENYKVSKNFKLYGGL
jgi:hypothetical protein